MCTNELLLKKRSSNQSESRTESRIHYCGRPQSYCLSFFCGQTGNFLPRSLGCCSLIGFMLYHWAQSSSKLSIPWFFLFIYFFASDLKPHYEKWLCISSTRKTELWLLHVIHGCDFLWFGPSIRATKYSEILGRNPYAKSPVCFSSSL